MVITIPDLAKEAGGLLVSTDKACPNGRSGKNKCSYGKSATIANRICVSA